MFHRFTLIEVVACQAGGQRGQAVFEVTVVVERLDQEMQRGLALGRQAQRQGLPVQVVLQRLMAACQLGGIDLAVVVVVLARRGVAAPLAVVGCGVDAAVALPAFLEFGLAARFRIILACSARIFCADCYGIRSGFKLAGFLADRRVDLAEPEILTRGGLLGHFKKRVFVEHLLDFLAQFQRRQLQQADRLLQLGREREVLRDAKRKTLLHSASSNPESRPFRSSMGRGAGSAGPQAQPP